MSTSEDIKQYALLKLGFNKFLIIISIFVLFIMLLIFIFWICYQAMNAQASTGGLNTKNIPTQYVSVVQKAGSMCKEVTSSLIAAQIEAESNWNPNAHSSAGAVGISQFLPSTFNVWATDGDGDGITDINNPQDEIMSQGKYMCAIVNSIKQSNIKGDIQSLALAAYNAGIFSVLKAKGMPNITETQNYVSKIKSLMVKYTNVTAAEGTKGTGQGVVAVTAAKKALGSMYHFGGSCVGFTNCDCSSLVQQAWHSAGVDIPRTTYEQVKIGSIVNNINDAQAGDLVFVDGSVDKPEHVVMYEGNGKIIEAPHSGESVREVDLKDWLKYSKVLIIKHIG